MSNTILDDISAVIGFSATQRIAVWFGDTNLYIPSIVDPGHALCGLIGIPAYARLVKEFGQTTLAIPHGTMRADIVQRRVAEMTILAYSDEAIAAALDLSARRIRQVKDALREGGLIALVAKRRLEISRKNRLAKSPQENPVEKAASDFGDLDDTPAQPEAVPSAFGQMTRTLGNGR